MMEQHASEWSTTEPKVFWGELAPSEHVCQVYENEDCFLNALEEFVLDGLRRGEGVILIATQNHLHDIGLRLMQNGIDPEEARAKNAYFPLLAEDVLRQFMVNGWPDEILFNDTITRLVTLAKRDGKQIRAFGEMVAMLWAQGHHGATVRLENLWTLLCEKELFRLFCAYPKSGFTQDPVNSLNAIYHTHSKIIAGWNKSKAQVYYKASATVAGKSF